MTECPQFSDFRYVQNRGAASTYSTVRYGDMYAAICMLHMHEGNSSGLVLLMSGLVGDMSSAQRSVLTYLLTVRTYFQEGEQL